MSKTSSPSVGDRMVMRSGPWTRSVTVVGVETSLSHGTRYLVAWASRLAGDPTLPGQATALCAASALRVG